MQARICTVAAMDRAVSREIFTYIDLHSSTFNMSLVQCAGFKGSGMGQSSTQTPAARA